MPRYDVALIGAGLVGLATARELLRRRPGLSLAVLDKEPSIASHQSGHNSGVIHSGIYYAPGSLKARLCVEGMREMYAYCEAKAIPTERCGKVIVATGESELGRLQTLYERGQANGVKGLAMIGPDALQELEPHCRGIRALWSPETGIVNYSRVAEAYADDVRAAGGVILTSHRLLTVPELPDELVLAPSSGEVRATRLITCAGVYTDRVAGLPGGAREHRRLYGEGAQVRCGGRSGQQHPLHGRRQPLHARRRERGPSSGGDARHQRIWRQQG